MLSLKKCQACDNETMNPKFCSRSCAAKTNNVKFPKRSVEGRCHNCNIAIISTRKYCDQCYQIRKHESRLSTPTNKNELQRQWRENNKKQCLGCNCSISYNSTRCRKCSASTKDWESLTLAEVRGKGNANAGSKYPYIRALSRKKYLASDKPQHCIVCGYDLHFDVAHIKDIKDFPPETLIAEVNHLNNLTALCRNHHWEFDHNHLDISSYL